MTTILKTLSNGVTNIILTFICLSSVMGILMKLNVIFYFIVEKKEIKEIIKQEVKQT